MRAHLVKHQYRPGERAAANLEGRTTYFTGRACKHGHIAARCTANGVCVECAKAVHKKVLKKRLALNPNWYKERYQKNPEKFARAAAEYRERNPLAAQQSQRKSALKRKPQKSAAERTRQASKLQRTPSWLTEAHWEQINAVYVAAHTTTKRAGFKCHVDHIIPLQGKTVCGLHVPWNLRVVSQSYNSKKKNNLDDSVLFAPSLTGGVLVHNSALPWNWSK